MQTTLRIDDSLYRDAKAEAAREGVTLTRFLEEGLRLRLRKSRAGIRTPYRFHAYDNGGGRDFPNSDQLKEIANREQEEFDLRKLRNPSREGSKRIQK
jgi:hypothetical protein